MPRRREVPKRKITPDPKYKDKLVSKFTNTLMYGGKKATAEGILYGSFDIVTERFKEDPIEVFKRNIYVHPFHEEDPIGLVGLLGPDRVLFGSDFPHPEGMSDPISFVDELSSLPHDVVAKIMGGNLGRIMKIEEAA